MSAIKFIATSKAELAAAKQQKLEDTLQRLDLHMEYHPQNPPECQIRCWLKRQHKKKKNN